MSAVTDRRKLHPDCACPIARHHHGSRVTYVVHRCRCDACREANTAFARARNRAKVYGRYDRFVDGDTVRDHLHALMDAGMGWKRIAILAGVNPSDVGTILYGRRPDQPDHPEHRPPRKKVGRVMAEKLLAVRLDIAGGQLVDATGTRRRIRALVAIGWSLNQLSDRLGITRTNFRLHEDEPTTVREDTRQKVVALYEELWDVRPVAVARNEKAALTRTLNLARRLGWAPPMAWDDETIDDPHAGPYTEAKFTRAERIAQRIADRGEEVRHFRDLGMTWPEVAEIVTGSTQEPLGALRTWVVRHAPDLVDDELRGQHGLVA